jgi:hypothetical protein
LEQQASLNAGKDVRYAQCVNKNYEGEIKNAGDTVNIIKPSDVSVSTLQQHVTYEELSPQT